MTYDPCDPVGSMAAHEHAKRRAAARTVAHHCGTSPNRMEALANTAMVLDMLGLLDPALLVPEPPRGLRRELSEVPPPFVP